MGRFVNLSLETLFAEAPGKPQPTPAIPLSGLDELAASIVHEVNQPLSAIKLNGETSLRWLDRDKPDIARARKSIERMLQDVGRALDIVSLIRAMAAGHTPQHSRIAIEQVITDALELLQHELCSKNVIVDVELTSAASDVIGNRLQ